MIAGGWAFIWGAYAISAAMLLVLAIVIILNHSRWSNRARASERRP